MTYGEFSDLFKQHFPNGRFDSFEYHGDYKVLFKGLKINNESEKQDISINMQTGEIYG